MNFHILHTEWSTGWGGQEQRIILECDKMRDLGHQVLIACQPGSGIHEKAVERSLPTAEVVMRSGFDPAAIRSLVRLIRTHDINVVNTHSGKDSWLGGFAAKLAGVDLLIRTRHLSVPISNNPLNFVYRMPDGIVTTGEAIRETMIRDNRIPPEKIVSIATGVSLDRFDASLSGDKVRHELGLAPDDKVVTMVAVLRSMKRHDLLLDVAGMLKTRWPELRFLIVGEGPQRAKIEQRIAADNLSDTVILTGYRSNVPDIFAASDVVVLTSDKFEGVPQTLSQAMAMGKPVVAAPVGSTGELVLDHVTGLRAEIGSAASFAEKIAALLTDSELRRTLGESARQHVLNGYTDRCMTTKTIAFYQRLLNEKSRRP